MRVKPDLSFRRLWDISFGFFGVQIAYALQSANISRIFATLGADPHNLSYFWILPPLAGIIVQPIVGALSDRTWNRFGRRIPYLIAGSAIAVAVMCLLPNAASFKGYIHAMWFGLIVLMMLDTSINMAMQPFKMLVGDMVTAKRTRLLHTKFPFQCRKFSRLLVPYPVHLYRYQQYRSPRSYPRFGNFLFLRRGSHIDTVYPLFFDTGERNATCGIPKISPNFGQRTDREE